MKSAFKALAPVAVVVTLLSATPAFSDSSACFTVLDLGILNCTTPPIWANGSGHFVYIEVGPFAQFEARDREHGQIIAHGLTGAGIHAENIFGLVSSSGYELQVWGQFATGFHTYAYMNNT